MKIYQPYIILLLSLLLFSCKDQQAPTEVATNDDSIIQISKEQFEHAAMKLGAVELHNFSNEIALNGHIEVPPHNKATIATYYGGYISYSPYLIGDHVKKGQVIIRMKNPQFIELQENYIKAYEQYQYLGIDFKRQKQLYEKSVIADQSFQEVQRAYKSALADINSLSAQLNLLNVDLSLLQEGHIVSDIEIKSPIDGVISSVDLNIGSYVPIQSEMMEIVNSSDLHLELDAFEKDIVSLQKGQEIEFNVIGSDQTFKAQLELIGSEVEAMHRTVTIHAELVENYPNLIPGLFVNAKVFENPEQLEALPREAFLSADGITYLLVLEEQTEQYYRFRKEAVQVSRSSHTHFAFDVTNLKAEQFLISGGFQLF